MVTRKQQAQDRYDRILPFVEEAAVHYDGNLDKGFRHWAFGLVFGVGHDIQDTDIIQLTAIDGADDFEIDGWYIPESDDDSVINLFQSKRRAPGTSMGAAELGAFLNAPRRITNAKEVAASHNEYTKELYDRIIDALTEDNRGCTVNLVWATSGTLSDSARRHAAENISKSITFEVNGNPVEIVVTLECLDLQDLHDRHRAQQDSDDPTAQCDMEFQLEEGSYHRTEAVWRTISMTVPVAQVIAAFRRHSYKIFRLNPRGPLGNKVNAKIKRTLNDPTNRQRFHLVNNGLTGICQSWRLEEGHKVIIRDFQIINGCQTTVTLWDARALVESDPNVLVSVKLVECPPHFASTIAEATNTQAALKAEDFTSNESVQIRLQSEFVRMNPPWFYQIKRGEWSKMLGGTQDKEKYRDPTGGYRKLTSKEVAQALVAFSGFPGEAKDRIRHFLNKDTIASLAKEGEFSYWKLYTDALSAKQLLLPAVIQRKVWKEVAEDKNKEEWLDYARFHILWLIGETLREHYKLEGYLFPPSRAETLALCIDDWFDSLYGIAVSAIAETKDEAEDGDQYPGHREFFRTPAHYRAMESKKRSGIRYARRFGDPMDALPA